MKLTRQNDFQIHPITDDKVQAVIVDITPTKISHTQYGDKPIFRLVYETEVEMEDGKRFCLWSRGYTETIGEKSNFYKDLKRILGRDLTEAEFKEGFDPEDLLGMPVELIVEHENGTDGTTYAVISFLARDKSKTPLVPSGDYVRVVDRPTNQSTQAGNKKADEQSTAYHSAPKAQASTPREDWQKCKVHVGKNAGVDLGDLQEDAVRALIEHWLPAHLANPKPKADDKRLAAALTTAAQILDPEPAKEDDLPY